MSLLRAWLHAYERRTAVIEAGCGVLAIAINPPPPELPEPEVDDAEAYFDRWLKVTGDNLEPEALEEIMFFRGVLLGEESGDSAEAMRGLRSSNVPRNCWPKVT